MIEVVVIFSKYRVIELEERFCILFDEESLIVCLDLILNQFQILLVLLDFYMCFYEGLVLVK